MTESKPEFNLALSIPGKAVKPSGKVRGFPVPEIKRGIGQGCPVDEVSGRLDLVRETNVAGQGKSESRISGERLCGR